MRKVVISSGNVLSRMPLSINSAERLNVVELDGYPKLEVVNATYDYQQKLDLMDRIEAEIETSNLKRSMELVSYSCGIKAWK